MSKKGYPFIILASAIALLFALQLVPWHSITGGRIKDFDLLGSLLSDSASTALKERQAAANEIVDSLYLAALAEMPEEQPAPESLGASTLADTPLRAKSIPDSAMAPAAPARVDGAMVIEDYTPDSRGLARLKEALGKGSARIAVIGDSYIEGDIFTQDIRSQLQNAYGGRGVGYMPAHSQVAGFRGTVRHTDSGWTHVPMQKASASDYFTLQGEYFVGDNGATVTYKGLKNGRLAKWNRSQLLFVAPAAGSITICTDTDTVTTEVEPSPEAQSIVVNGETSQMRVTSRVPGLIFLGAYLDDCSGVSVDCMSIRGYSGISHRKINKGLADSMRKHVDYDLVIIEYGINALTSEQTNYSRYGDMMAQVAQRVQECYPGADVLLMGIGDRGQKVDGDVRSMPTAQAMVDAQRNAARKAGCLFWDTREAMGGDGAIVNWRERKLVNADYIHLNSAGGKALATELVNSINRMASE